VDHQRLARASRWWLALEFAALAQAQAGRWPPDCRRAHRIVWSNETESWFTTKRGCHVAQLGYLYSVAGRIQSGLYKREFPTHPAADDFVRDLKGKEVAVRYSPSKPLLSMVLKSDIEAVLLNRPPSSDDEGFGCTAIPEWLRAFIWVFVWLSAIGLLVSLWVHVGAADWRGFSGLWMVFHSSAPAILYSGARTEESSPRCGNGHFASLDSIYCTP
jgi:hypothetical protein